MSKKIIKIKHIIEYLQQFDLESQVILDKDGWLKKELDENVTISNIIESRGLFEYSECGDFNILYINN